jgi:hypothetical protein
MDNIAIVEQGKKRIKEIERKLIPGENSHQNSTKADITPPLLTGAFWKFVYG